MAPSKLCVPPPPWPAAQLSRRRSRGGHQIAGAAGATAGLCASARAEPAAALPAPSGLQARAGSRSSVVRACRRPGSAAQPANETAVGEQSRPHHRDRTWRRPGGHQAAAAAQVIVR